MLVDLMNGDGREDLKAVEVRVGRVFHESDRVGGGGSVGNVISPLVLLPVLFERLCTLGMSRDLEQCGWGEVPHARVGLNKERDRRFVGMAEAGGTLE